MIALTSVALAIGCGASYEPLVTRHIDGEPVTGPFVSPFSYEYFIRGEIALARGDLREAAEAFRLARAGPEEDPLVLARLAEVLDALGETSDADAVLIEARELFPDSEATWLAFAKVAERRGENARAIGYYERAEHAAPASELAPLAIARLLADEAPQRAQAVLSRFSRRVASGSIPALRARLELAVLTNDATAAEEAVRALLVVAPARAREVADVARTMLEAGRPALAAGLLDAVPLDAVPIDLRIEALLGAGRSERAEAVIVLADDRTIGGPVARARLLLRVGRAEAASEIAEREALAASDPDAALVWGLAEDALGHHGEAARILAGVPRAAPGYTDARIALARILEEQGLAGLAAEVLRTTPADRSGRLAARRELARLRVERGDGPAAVEALDGLRGARSVVARARVLERLGRPEEAVVAWASARADEPSLDPASRLRVRAERLAADGRFEDAIGLLNDLVAFAPEDLHARARLAELQARAGHRDLARTAAEETLRLTSDPVLRARVERIAAEL
jgi:tetratricopeptide (TPR) repeat protein